MYPSVAYLPQGSQYTGAVGGVHTSPVQYPSGSRHLGGAHANPMHPYQAKSWHHGRRKDRVGTFPFCMIKD